LYVTEFPSASVDHGAGVPVAFAPSVGGINNNVTISGTHAESSAFGTNTRLVRLHTDTICYVKFGTAPVAVTVTDARMAANQTEYFAVQPGGGMKVSVVA
jgi:hypothetical protein